MLAGRSKGRRTQRRLAEDAQSEALASAGTGRHLWPPVGPPGHRGGEGVGVLAAHLPSDPSRQRDSARWAPPGLPPGSQVADLIKGCPAFGKALGVTPPDRDWDAFPHLMDLQSEIRP